MKTSEKIALAGVVVGVAGLAARLGFFDPNGPASKGLDYLKEGLGSLMDPVGAYERIRAQWASVEQAKRANENRAQDLKRVFGDIENNWGFYEDGTPWTPQDREMAEEMKSQFN